MSTLCQNSEMLSFIYPVYSYNYYPNKFFEKALKDYTEDYDLPQLFINGKYIGDHIKIEELYKTGELKYLIDRNESSVNFCRSGRTFGYH